MDDPRPGFRWPVSGSRRMPVSSERLWEAISRPGNLELGHPYCARNPVLKWPGADAHDEVHYLGGMVLERHFLRWVDGVGYDLEIGRPGGRRSVVAWRILPEGDDAATLDITVYPAPLQRLPVIVRWLPHRLRLRPPLEQYLSSVVRGFEWFVTRGEPVPRNQFGYHPWFSPGPD